MKRWVIINLHMLQSNRNPFGEFGEDCIIPEKQRPAFVHHDKAEAEKELLRLASTHPGEFVLFEAVAKTSRILTRLGYVERLDPIEP
jgi:hypothetical protein